MRPDLTRLISELRKETCPLRVLDEVQRRTTVKTSSSLRLRFAISMVAILLLAGGLLAWRWQEGAGGRASLKLAERAASDRIRIARQTEAALRFMGSLLAQAGTDSEKIISNRAAAPLQNSFQTTKNKIIQPLDL